MNDKSSADKSLSGHSCGECARFKVPDSGCPWAEDIRRGVILAEDPASACDAFYPARERRKREVKKKDEKEPQELIKEELERQAAVRLHPLMDYHPQTGFSLGIFPLGNKQSLVFLDERPFLTSSNVIQLQQPKSMSVLVRKPKWIKLHEEQAYILLQVAREFFENGEIKFPAEKEVFNEVLGKITYYWWHSDNRYYILVACWITGTYYHRLFAFFPALNPQGQRQTGKTTLLEIITQCAWNPTGRETAVREADLFRTIEGTRGTYVLDVTILDKSKDTRDVIDVIETGTEIGGCVRRIHPKTGKPMEFETYGPKAIATRYELPFVGKCIRIITEQAPNPEYAKRRALLPFDKDWRRIKELLLKAAIRYWPEVKKAYESLEQTDKLCGRVFNYWAPVLAVCKVFAPEHFNALLKLAEEDAERAEKGDRLSEVEEAVLSILLEEKTETVTILLKELTQHVQNIVPWVKDWHIVVSALENLRVIQRKYQTSKGVQYQINIKKLKEEAEKRKPSINEKTPKHGNSQSLPVKLERLTTNIVDRCMNPSCRFTGRMDWQATYPDGSWALLCYDCGLQLFRKIQEAQNG